MQPSWPPDDSSSGETRCAGRGQWTVEEAWAWHRKVGVIRGFNSTSHGGLVTPPHPGMTRKEVLRRAAAIGYNSVRFWYSTKDEAHALMDEAEANGMTVSLVIGPPGPLDALARNEEQAWAAAKAYVQGIVGEFRDDPRIVLWDLYNEPKNWHVHFRLLKEVILWARAMGPTQPLSASIFHWLPDLNENAPVRAEAEGMCDVHNFHLYDCSEGGMAGIERMVATLKGVSDRPIVCAECLARSRGDTFGRILPAFARHQIHWYNWGLFACDANWTLSWERSAFDPHEPWFHEVLHPDGTPYDWRDLDLIRQFRFARRGEDPDPGVEVTDRWLKERAWKWVNTGPVRGWTCPEEGAAAMERDLARAQAAGCDSLRVRLDCAAWSENPAQFRGELEALLELAGRHGMTVTPVLLTDADARHPANEVAGYVGGVVKTFGFDARIYCWELYHRPGGGGLAGDKARALLLAAFRAARFEFPNQPLTATPAVGVEAFAADFDYRKAMSHRAGLEYSGWNMLRHEGGSDAELCAFVWGMSDVLSLASSQGAPETGWLLGIANRYGRPVICTEWAPPDAASVEDTLKLFSAHHVRWYAAARAVFDEEASVRHPDLARLVKQFRFGRVMTPRQ